MSRDSRGRFLMVPYWLRNAFLTRLFRLFFARSFAAFGANAYVLQPDGIAGPENISIGRDVVVDSHAYLAARSLHDAEPVSLTISDGCRLGRFNHIHATRRIHIGPSVLTGPNVYIADNTHSFDNPEVPIYDQPVVQLGEVSIGSGTWIGHGAKIIGARIGRNCVIGASALVRNDIPDLCMAVGSPARIVKRYDPEARCWRKCAADGSFAESPDNG
ncbi:acyltransferase [Actibacterium sp. D379-3]